WHRDGLLAAGQEAGRPATQGYQLGLGQQLDQALVLQRLQEGDETPFAVQHAGEHVARGAVGCAGRAAQYAADVQLRAAHADERRVGDGLTHGAAQVEVLAVGQEVKGHAAELRAGHASHHHVELDLLDAADTQGVDNAIRPEHHTLGGTQDDLDVL